MVDRALVSLRWLASKPARHCPATSLLPENRLVGGSSGRPASRGHCGFRRRATGFRGGIERERRGLYGPLRHRDDAFRAGHLAGRPRLRNALRCRLRHGLWHELRFGLQSRLRFRLQRRLCGGLCGGLCALRLLASRGCAGRHLRRARKNGVRAEIMFASCRIRPIIDRPAIVVGMTTHRAAGRCGEHAQNGHGKACTDHMTTPSPERAVVCDFENRSAPRRNEHATTRSRERQSENLA